MLPVRYPHLSARFWFDSGNSKPVNFIARGTNSRAGRRAAADLFLGVYVGLEPLTASLRQRITVKLSSVNCYRRHDS
jgi:hypothetical protein